VLLDILVKTASVMAIRELTPADAWFQSRAQHIPLRRVGIGERRPLDLIRRRQARELLDAIASERTGSFA